ncbi:hypothetical protein HZ326_0211 [Fusarium oxysporum f. sp. albedinis]|nr:hypothetical protein HZ326_0211 [Fusarium oxysporum f. sp. albedinis]
MRNDESSEQANRQCFMLPSLISGMLGQLPTLNLDWLVKNGQEAKKITACGERLALVLQAYGCSRSTSRGSGDLCLLCEFESVRGPSDQILTSMFLEIRRTKSSKLIRG